MQKYNNIIFDCIAYHMIITTIFPQLEDKNDISNNFFL